MGGSIFSYIIPLLILVLESHSTMNVPYYRLQLRKHLESKKNRFEKTSPPNVPDLTVASYLSIISIFGLNDKEILEMNIWVTLTWTDPRFRWNSSEWYGVSNIEMNRDDVWFPDIGIWNAKEPRNADFRQVNLRTLIVKEDGSVTAFLPLLVSIPCPIEVKYFPFDHQSCRIILGTVASPRSYFRLLLKDVKLNKAKETPMGEWRPLNYTKTLSSTYFKSVDYFYDFFLVDILLERKPLYHISVVIIPFILLTAMALLMFVVQQVGDRIGVSIAVILAMSVYVMITSQDAPKSMMQIPLLCIFLLIQMCLLILFTYVAVVCAVAPKMKEKSEGGGMRRFWQWLVSYRLKSDIFSFLLYLVLTALNSVICLYIVPNFLRKE